MENKERQNILTVFRIKETGKCQVLKGEDRKGQGGKGGMNGAIIQGTKFKF